MITVQFKDFDDMMAFAKQMCGVATVTTIPEPQLVPAAAVTPNPVTAVPTAVPVSVPPVAPVSVPTAAPVPPPNPAAPSVPTSAPSYSLEDLTKAAIGLMDAGGQSVLLQLLTEFGVEALPSLQPAQYGTFATRLREMGARI